MITCHSCEQIMYGHIFQSWRDNQRSHTANLWSHDSLCLWSHDSLCLNLFHLLARKPNLEKKIHLPVFKIFVHNFRLSESSFTCPGLRASGLLSAKTCIIQLRRELYDDMTFSYGQMILVQHNIICILYHRC